MFKGKIMNEIKDMTDEEYHDYCKTGFSFFTSFILFPAVSLILMVFGYTKTYIIISHHT